MQEELPQVEVKSERIRLEVTGGDESFYLDCPNKAPLGQVYDVIVQLKGYIINRMIEDHNKNIEEAGQDPSLCQEDTNV